ncbi:MAG: hypothetical protein LBS67_05535 [Clostridiales Family XIII bacterium]|jgi:hypothetical protein|nr:hypothetical protein [Clostridiales Family XIII bacterium]
MRVLTDTDAFLIKDASGNSYYGGDQDWFGSRKEYRKEAACGATTCANILGYLARTREALSDLAPYDLHEKERFLSFMKVVYPFVRPGLIGIMPADFTRGVTEYSAERGYAFEYDILTVPAASSKRPGEDTMYDFLNVTIADDLPVAFLNLSGGRVKNLDNYHWVTLVGLDDQSGMCRIVDNGRLMDVNLKKWLRRSVLGGAFVVVRP